MAFAPFVPLRVLSSYSMLEGAIDPKAIAKHAWTFAGSGSFRVVTPWRFEIVDNPIVRGERSDTPLCHWHAAVFERLYQVLVDRTAMCREVACCAVTGGNTCRFDITLAGRAGA